MGGVTGMGVEEGSPEVGELVTCRRQKGSRTVGLGGFYWC